MNCVNLPDEWVTRSIDPHVLDTVQKIVEVPFLQLASCNTRLTAKQDLIAEYSKLCALLCTASQDQIEQAMW